MPQHPPLYVPMLAHDLAHGVKKALKKAAGVAFVDPMNKALFIRRADNGVWEFPGGHLEDGETPSEAMTREAFEELGGTWQDNLVVGPAAEWGSSADFGVDYTTFKQFVDEPFTPELNEESTEFKWAPLAQPPEPLHPGVSALLEAGYTAERGNDQAFAFDYASVQSQDADGRLHVTSANVTKANICPYLGEEIPDHEALKLEPKKVYWLLRDPDELAKAVSTFNNIPILDEHIPHSSAEPQQEKTIGTTGSEAIFVYPYLRNSLAFWVEGPIEEIKAKTRRELSSSYRYRADMTPGTWNGARYDGVMRNIIANHVALVKEGRAGSDVIVGDSKRKRNVLMKTKTKGYMMSPIGLITQGVLMHALGGGVLAADSKLNIAKHLEGLTKKNFAAKKQGIVDAITKDAKPMLATDAALPDLITLLDAVEKVEAIDEVTPLMTAPPAGADEPAPFKGKPDADDEEDDDKKEKKADDEDDDDDKKKKGDDEFPPKKDDEKKEKKADDKMGKDAVNKMVNDAVAKAKAEQVAIREAEKFVRPWVGDLAMAHDSAAAVHKAALDVLKIDVEGIHESAFKKLIEIQPKPGETRRANDSADELAMDEAAADSFHKRFPGSERIRSA